MKITEEMIDKAVAEVNEEIKSSIKPVDTDDIQSLDDISKLGASIASLGTGSNTEFTVRLIKKLFVGQDLG